MKHTDLISREPEYMALLGNMEPDFGSVAFDVASEAAPDFGSDYEEDDDYGADAPVSAMAASKQASQMMAHPAHQQRAHQIVAAHLHKQAKSSQSQDRLHPNKGNPVPTYRWDFSINGTVTAVGTAQTTLGGGGGLQQAPNIGVFKPDTLTVNVPNAGWIYIQDIKVLSQSLLLGGSADAYKFTPISTSKKLHSVPLNPAIPVTILCTASALGIIGSTYTGAYTLDFNFEGWASPVGMPTSV